jgi:hypothetical protein
MKDLTGRKAMVSGDDIKNRNVMTEWSNQDDETPSGLMVARFFAGKRQYVSEIAGQIWCCYALLSNAISPTHVLGGAKTLRA